MALCEIFSDQLLFFRSNVCQTHCRSAAKRRTKRHGSCPRQVTNLEGTYPHCAMDPGAGWRHLQRVSIGSRAPDEGSSPGKKDTGAILESMTYAGGMNYAKYRLEASRAKDSGKQKKVQPLTLCMQDELDSDNGDQQRRPPMTKP